MLKPVVLYYFLFDRKPRNVLFDLYTKHLGKSGSEANRLIHLNFLMIGRSLVDKVAFLIGKKDRFEFVFDGHEILKDLEKRGKGAVLISAHLGNWDLAGNMLRSTDLTVPINVVMFEAEYEKTKEYVAQVTGGHKFNIIPIRNDLSHIIRIKAALNNGEFICIHGDRFTEGARTSLNDFLDSKAHFPTGPFEIACRSGVPTVFVYNIKTGKYQYSLFSSPPVIEHTTAQELQQGYIRDLEKMLLKFPEHWFNYYDFFENNDSDR